MTLYDLLGVAPGADDDAIKGAYRKWAKAYHPDLNPADDDAAEKFREVCDAFAVLRDREQRAAYDDLLDGYRRETRKLRMANMAMVLIINIGVVTSTTIAARAPAPGVRLETSAAVVTKPNYAAMRRKLQEQIARGDAPAGVQNWTPRNQKYSATELTP